MPTTNARKHAIPSPGDTSVSRATIFEAFANSIRDVVPVANTTERAQLVAALTAVGQGPTTSNPVYVFRADAPGMDRIECSTDGSVWIPASGRLTFASKSAADTWATANGALLTAGDKARVGEDEYRWSGIAWVLWDSGWRTASSGIAAGTGTINDGNAQHTWKFTAGVVIDSVVVNIINAGTGSGALTVEMPFSVSGSWMGVGRSESDGSQVAVKLQGSSATVFKYNNTSPVAAASPLLLFTITARAA